MFFLKYKKIIHLILIISIVFSSVFFVNSKKTEAWTIFTMPVDGVANWFTATSSFYTKYKDNILDYIAWVAADLLIQKITASTLTWINSGFDGNPAYITDFSGFVEDYGDSFVGKMIEEGTEFKFLCSSFDFNIRSALIQQFVGSKKSKCTLSGIVGNVEGSMERITDRLGDNWDWDTWTSITQSSGNNVFDSYVETSLSINANLSKGQREMVDKLNWGSGFLSQGKCIEYTEYDRDFDGEVDPIDEQDCSKEEIVTPGSLLQESAGESLKIGGRRLAVADEFNEIVGAALVAIITEAMGNGGVRGLSQKDPETGNSAIDNILTNIEDYENTKEDLETITFEDSLIEERDKAEDEYDEYQNENEEPLSDDDCALLELVANDFSELPIECLPQSDSSETGVEIEDVVETFLSYTRHSSLGSPRDIDLKLTLCPNSPAMVSCSTSNFVPIVEPDSNGNNQIISRGWDESYRDIPLRIVCLAEDDKTYIYNIADIRVEEEGVCSSSSISGDESSLVIEENAIIHSNTNFFLYWKSTLYEPNISSILTLCPNTPLINKCDNEFNPTGFSNNGEQIITKNWDKNYTGPLNITCRAENNEYYEYSILDINEGVFEQGSCN